MLHRLTSTRNNCGSKWASAEVFEFKGVGRQVIQLATHPFLKYVIRLGLGRDEPEQFEFRYLDEADPVGAPGASVWLCPASESAA